MYEEEIPGYPDYTIDLQGVVRSYRTKNKGKVIDGYELPNGDKEYYLKSPDKPKSARSDKVLQSWLLKITFER